MPFHAMGIGLEEGGGKGKREVDKGKGTCFHYHFGRKTREKKRVSRDGTGTSSIVGLGPLEKRKKGGGRSVLLGKRGRD